MITVLYKSTYLLSYLLHTYLTSNHRLLSSLERLSVTLTSESMTFEIPTIPF